MPTSPARAEHPENSRNDSGRRAARGFVFGVTLFVVLAALVVSIALVVYTAYLHDLWNGGFALIFAVLSAQVALNWLLWRDDEEE